jgi:hypothetical protein
VYTLLKLLYTCTMKPIEHTFSCRLTDKQFEALLVLFSVDVSCLDNEHVVSLRDLLNDEASLRGCIDWIEAYNRRTK